MKQDIEEGYLDLLYAFPFHYHFLFLFEVVTRCGFDRYQMGLSSKALHETRVFCSGSNKRYRRGISSSQAHLQVKNLVDTSLATDMLRQCARLELQSEDDFGFLVSIFKNRQYCQ